MNFLTIDPTATPIEKGAEIQVRDAKGNVIVGTFISINSKGINVKDETGKVVSRSLTSATEVALVVEDTTPVVEDADDAGVADGLSTAEVAEIFGIAAKELRVHLRAMNLGVGKGRRYGLSAEDVKAVRDHLNTNA